jgi:hypothetical protein
MSIIKFPGETSTPEVPDALARDERFRDLEHEVCNLERAGKIVEHFVAGWLNVADNPLPRDAELAVYAVEQLCKRLTEFRADYYRAWGPAGGES